MLIGSILIIQVAIGNMGSKKHSNPSIFVLLILRHRIHLRIICQLI